MGLKDSLRQKKKSSVIKERVSSQLLWLCHDFQYFRMTSFVLISIFLERELTENLLPIHYRNPARTWYHP